MVTRKRQAPSAARKRKAGPARRETIHDRIRQVRLSEGLSQGGFALALAKALGRPRTEARTQSQISSIEHGDSGVPVDVIEAIGNMGYDLEWLVCGRTRGEAARDMLGDNPDMLRVVADLKELQPAELAFVQKWLELYVQGLHRDQKEEA